MLQHIVKPITMLEIYRNACQKERRKYKASREQATSVPVSFSRLETHCSSGCSETHRFVLNLINLLPQGAASS